MTHKELTDNALLVSFAAPKALRTVAKKFKVSTGAIRVLNAILFRKSTGKSTSSAHLQASKTSARTLLRANIAELVTAGLLERQTGRGPWLRLTLQALGAESEFQRELRTHIRQFSQA
jgi:hypothetical protein